MFLHFTCGHLCWLLTNQVCSGLTIKVGSSVSVFVSSDELGHNGAYLSFSRFSLVDAFSA